ncbi:MAG TPA: alcohol dehydrogenase catalytic domain-containing protein [Nitrospiraceae bacterium]|nr:alcohol dehydrogenase catalytic domain-containing protein [Nitrospiraceae bacterium]
MRALRINHYGGPDVLKLDSNAPRPVPGKGQVLIEVQAASINPIDWKVRAGYMKDMVPLTMPATLGGDVAGRVVEVGEGVSGVKSGDRLYGIRVFWPEGLVLSPSLSWRRHRPLLPPRKKPTPPRLPRCRWSARVRCKRWKDT